MTLSGKKVLVTGADGFIGSHLVEMLHAAGADVRALAQYNSFNSWGWLDTSPIAGQIEVISGDIRDPQVCRKLTEGVDTVFHLAALIAIPYSYLAPGTYVETNVGGTLNICQAALESGCRKVIVTSTSEVYGTAIYAPIDEKHPLQAQSPYSASKIGADAIATSYFNAFSLPVTIARPFNTYGPRQSARAIIPTIISQIAAGQTQIKLGDLRPTRDLNYVEDTCRGFLLLAETPGTEGEVFNIGSNQEVSIGDLADCIKALMGKEVQWCRAEERMRPDKSEVFRLLCDNSKITKLGYKPQIDLNSGLKKTIEWLRKPENLSKYKVGLFNL